MPVELGIIYVRLLASFDGQKDDTADVVMVMTMTLSISHGRCVLTHMQK